MRVVRDFLPLIQHMHLKDYSGGSAFQGYSPLRQGQVDLAAVLKMMDGKTLDRMLMVELDASANMPLTPAETAGESKAYLAPQGLVFRV